MKRVLTLLFVAILLFFFKEQLRAECDTKGKISYIANANSYSLYFETLPWTDCAGYGLGWITPSYITVEWTIESEDCNLVKKVSATPKDTIEIKANGGIYVTCNVVYHYEQQPDKRTYPFPIWFFVDGNQCLEILTSPGPVIATQPENSLTIENGVISAYAIFGILKVFSYPDFIPLQAGFIEFEGTLIFSLKQVFGAGNYYVETLFTNPYQDISLGVVKID